MSDLGVLIAAKEQLIGPGGNVDAYDVMHEWDREMGNEARTDEELDKAVPALLPGTDYQVWKGQLEARDIEAIKLGMKCWGLPIRHLGQFEVDDAIGTMERNELGDGLKGGK